MKNNIINKLLVISALCLLVTGCKKWLGVRPSTEIREEQLFTTADGFKDALTGVYTSLARPALYGENLTAGMIDVLSQVYTIPTNHRMYEFSRYNYGNTSNALLIDNIWLAAYNTIVNINNIIRQADARPALLGSRDYALIKGEAIGLRALLHFDLLRMFAPAYISSSTAPAIPYVRDISLKVTPQGTVSAVLDSIIADLNEAAGLLEVYPEIDNFSDLGFVPDNNALLSYRKNHFNYYAAKALLARVYLYKQDKPHALENALEVINSEKFSFTTSAAFSSSGDNRDRTSIPEQIFSLHVFDLNNTVDKLFQDADYYNELGMTPAKFDMLFDPAVSSTDIRRNNLWQTIATTWYPTKLWQEDKISIEYRQLMPLIRLPEMYYIAAEAATDTEEGLEYLNTVRKERAISLLPSGISGEQLQKEIFKEYRKELICEGQLFFYYKRKNLDLIEGTDIIPGNSVYVFPLPDNEVLFGNRK